jgi:cysteine desulfurase
MVEDTTGAYLDHGAASPLDPRVREAMTRFLNADFGSPESLHDWARAPADALETARAAVGALIGADPAGVIFTAGDTEARNLAVKGIAAAHAHRGRHVVTTAVEHPAVLAACRTLARGDLDLTIVGVDVEGRVHPATLAAAVRDETVLVSVSHGQAEIGTVQDVRTLVAAVRARNPDTTIHVDAAVTAGLVPVDATEWDCDAITIGGGSLGGPRWVGALWVREGTRLHPLIEGGLQESGKRGGVHDVSGIAGMGEAARLAADERDARAAHMTALAERLIDGLLRIEDVRLNGPRRGRVPGHVQVSVGRVEGETLVLTLGAHGVAASPGSACSAAGKASPVLEAIGVEPPWTHSAVLFTLAPTTTQAQIDTAIGTFTHVVAALRAMSPLRETA